eukprot:Em0704g1a
MAAQLQVGIDIVGKIKKTYGKKGVIRQVLALHIVKSTQCSGRRAPRLKYRGICLPYVFGQLKASALQRERKGPVNDVPAGPAAEIDQLYQPQQLYYLMGVFGQ